MSILEVPSPCVKLFANDNLGLPGELEYKDVRAHVFIEPATADAQVARCVADAKPTRWVVYAVAH